MNKYTHRKVEPKDLQGICRMPQNADELFYMFPRACYPLDEIQLMEAIENRKCSTVFLDGNTLIGFANFYEVEHEDYCSLGNIIVHPEWRGKNVSDYIVTTMEDIGKRMFDIKEMHLSCFNNNVKGLLLYHRLRYIPYEIEKRTDKENRPIALIKMKKKLY